MRKQYTEEQRAELVRLVRRDEVPLRRAAARLGVAESTAYYWMKQPATARQRTATKPRSATAEHQRGAPPLASRTAAKATRAVAFARLIPASEAEPSLVLCVGAARLEVRAGFDAALLRAVVAALVEVP